MSRIWESGCAASFGPRVSAGRELDVRTELLDRDQHSGGPAESRCEEEIIWD
jgi:hypothetical protein